MSAEFAGPAWAFGMRWYGFLGRRPSSPASAKAAAGISAPSTLTPAAGSSAAALYRVLGARDRRWPGGPARRRAPTARRRSSCSIRRADSVTELCTAGDLPADPTYLARPEAITFASEGGAIAHAFYYPPTNPDFRAPRGELPPLIVKSHGGPTGSTSSRAPAGDPVLDLARLCGVRRQLRRQHRLWPRLSRAAERPLGRGRRAGLHRRRARSSWRSGGRTRAGSRSPAAAPAATPRSAR